jgi:hypothetical protein
MSKLSSSLAENFHAVTAALRSVHTDSVHMDSAYRDSADRDSAHRDSADRGAANERRAMNSDPVSGEYAAGAFLDSQYPALADAALAHGGSAHHFDFGVEGQPEASVLEALEASVVRDHYRPTDLSALHEVEFDIGAADCANTGSFAVPPLGAETHVLRATCADGIELTAHKSGVATAPSYGQKARFQRAFQDALEDILAAELRA